MCRRTLFSLSVLLAASLTGPFADVARAAPSAGGELGRDLPLWSTFPFLGLLLSIALFPLLASRFWHRRYGAISAAWALVLAVPLLFVYRERAAGLILETYVHDYIPFIILLGSLFTVGGGIVIRGAASATPAINTLVLLIGTLLASLLGTTGASMLLIRPLLRANAWRRRRAHVVVFFIFLVSNIGGSLTPLGDPPLFLGYLQGVPFFWTLRLLPQMGLAAGVLLALFYALDRWLYRRDLGEERAMEPRVPVGGRLELGGARNLVFFAGIMGAVLLSGSWNPGAVSVLGMPLGIQNVVRDALLLLMAFLSYRFTARELRRENEFTWFPIREVAILFAGIFMTMIPALAILRAGLQGEMAPLVAAVRTPAHFFWSAGALSSFLDNAPTYLTFLNLSMGAFFPHQAGPQAVASLLAERALYVKAISAGAVFMGANTYIGNAPNFMVRSIAQENGVAMPSFIGYMIKYSIPILIPLFLIVTWCFY